MIGTNAPIFAALGDPGRLSIIQQLCADGPLSTALLNEAKSVTRQGLTKHLRVLESAGLVSSMRVGRDRLWDVRAEQIEALRACLDLATQHWEARLGRLKVLVESGA